MSGSTGFENTREYKFREWVRYTRTRPYVCQPLMKNFWQCYDYFHFGKNLEDSEAKSQCLEKFNYEECFNENKDKLYENLPYNIEELVIGDAGGDEEDE